MKPVLLAGLALVAIGLLAVIAYQVSRANLSPAERECTGLFVSEIETATCRLNQALR